MECARSIGFLLLKNLHKIEFTLQLSNGANVFLFPLILYPTSGSFGLGELMPFVLGLSRVFKVLHLVFACGPNNNSPTGTLGDFDPIKNNYIFGTKWATERRLIVLIEALTQCEEYHSYHIEDSVGNEAVKIHIEFHTNQLPTVTEKEVGKAVRA